MHFSIPDTTELKDGNETPYTAFNLHVNGVLHCTVRYSQLNDLNEQFKQEYSSDTLPFFPPKRFFAVKGADLEERRQQLEKYIQEICQNPTLSRSDTLANFLSTAQQETQHEATTPVTFDITLMNGSQLSLNIQNTDKTDVILENAMQRLGIEEDLTYYFGLFLMKNDEDGKYSLIRQLQEFECPYISFKSINKPSLYKVVIRKSYWDQAYDDIIMKDDVGLNLLNVQAESDVKAGWIMCKQEIKQRLSNLKSKGSKKEFVKLCQTLSNYGYIQFNECITDFPQKNTKVILSTGNYQIKFQTIMSTNDMKQETFPVTRIKSWKISSHMRNQLKDSNKQPVDQQVLHLSFEYLIGKGNLKWISIQSSQAIMISMAIKSMVDELIRKRHGNRIKKPADRNANLSKPTYKPRDKTTESLFNDSGIQIGDFETAGGVQKAKESVKKISGKISNVSILSKSDADEQEVPVSTTVKNVFAEIGDEDL